MTKKAEAGIGTLILFIAMILVAAVAAGVLIQTSGSLQSKALYTGSRAETQVSSEVSIVEVYGEDGTAHYINKSYMKVKLAAGSDPIKLADALLQVDMPTTKTNLAYNASMSDCAVAKMEGNDQVGYGARYLAGASQDDGYIERGDVVELCFSLSEQVDEGEDLRVAFVPKVGHTTLLETKAPDVMLDQRVLLYP